MNVTIVCEGFSISSINLQPWRRIYEISKRIAKHGIKVTILSDGNSRVLEAENIDGITMKRINHLIWSPILNRKKILTAIRADDPDIVIWYGTHLSALYITQLRSIRKPLIWDMERELNGFEVFRTITVRELFHPHHSFLWQQMVTAFLPRRLIRIVANSSLIAKIIVPGNSLKVSLTGIGIKPGKVTVIPSTVEKELHDSLSTIEKSRKMKIEAGLDPDDFMVAYFGPPCTLRGIDTAILSMEKIKPKRKDIRLVIFSRRNLRIHDASDVSLKAEEADLTMLINRLGLDDCIKLISGVLEKAKLRDFFAASDVIVLPFKLVLSEPPLLILEAMGMGKTVITTNLKSLSEIVGTDRGILIEPKNASALAKAILFLSDHPQQSAQIGKNAIEFTANLPDWEDIAIQVANLIKTIPCNQFE